MTQDTYIPNRYEVGQNLYSTGFWANGVWIPRGTKGIVHQQHPCMVRFPTTPEAVAVLRHDVRTSPDAALALPVSGRDARRTKETNGKF